MSPRTMTNGGALFVLGVLCAVGRVTKADYTADRMGMNAGMKVMVQTAHYEVYKSLPSCSPYGRDVEYEDCESVMRSWTEDIGAELIVPQKFISMRVTNGTCIARKSSGLKSYNLVYEPMSVARNPEGKHAEDWSACAIENAKSDAVGTVWNRNVTCLGVEINGIVIRHQIAFDIRPGDFGNFTKEALARVSHYGVRHPRPVSYELVQKVGRNEEVHRIDFQEDNQATVFSQQRKAIAANWIVNRGKLFIRMDDRCIAFECTSGGDLEGSDGESRSYSLNHFFGGGVDMCKEMKDLPPHSVAQKDIPLDSTWRTMSEEDFRVDHDTYEQCGGYVREDSTKAGIVYEYNLVDALVSKSKSTGKELRMDNCRLGDKPCRDVNCPLSLCSTGASYKLLRTCEREDERSVWRAVSEDHQKFVEDLKLYWSNTGGHWRIDKVDEDVDDTRALPLPRRVLASQDEDCSFFQQKVDVEDAAGSFIAGVQTFKKFLRLKGEKWIGSLTMDEERKVHNHRPTWYYTPWEGSASTKSRSIFYWNGGTYSLTEEQYGFSDNRRHLYISTPDTNTYLKSGKVMDEWTRSGWKSHGTVERGLCPYDPERMKPNLEGTVVAGAGVAAPPATSAGGGAHADAQ